ncbi:Common plant regulatory factor [Ranunculus cassubicifolius]
MGSSEGETPAKPEKPSPEKPSSPAPPEQQGVHVYPDWAAMQAYYGAGVALPPQYFNPAVAAAGHHPHPFMWGPQPMMPPYGAPYGAMYPHGGIYAHPSLSLGSQGHGVPPSPSVPAPMGIPTPSKSTSTADQGSKKKTKGSDGLAVSIGNGNDGSTAGPQSEEDGNEGSSDGSDGNTEAGGGPAQRKRRHDDTPSNTSQVGNAVSGAGKPMEMVPLRVPPSLEMMGSTAGMVNIVPSAPDAAIPPELWMKDERALKREKRKQSNRESARRSRLRKQAESEELAVKVESLNTENLALRSEINRLTENSEKLKIENTALLERLNSAQQVQSGEIVSNKDNTTENFLSMVNNNNPENGVKLHQLLKSSPRADPVAAG